jgi:hypothetical protein
MVRQPIPRPAALAAFAALAILVVACTSPGGSAPSPTVAVASSNRPSSPAVVMVVQPTAGAAITPTPCPSAPDSCVHIKLSLTGATIVSATSTDIRPDQGHVHLYVDNVLVSMNYGLEQDLPVHSGTYVLKAEFVAADHAPFNPRVWSPEVLFTVK